MQLAANLTYLFTELPMLSRFDAAREAGFTGVEILFPYDLPAKPLARAARAAGQKFVSMNTPAPNWAGGPRGFAAIPGHEARFRKDFRRMQAIAAILRPQHINIMPGKADGPAARRTLIDNLRWATAEAPDLSLLIEPTAAAIVPGVFLDSLGQALDIIEAVDAPNLGLQFDAFHLHHMTGDLPGALALALPHLRHVQIAGYPHRNEPENTAINYREFFDDLAANGYDGWVSAEYAPARQTSEGLGWITAILPA